MLPLYTPKVARPARLGKYAGALREISALPATWAEFKLIFFIPVQNTVAVQESETTVEVRFKKEVMDLTVDFVYFLFVSYREGTVDLSVLIQREQAIGERVRKHLHGA